MGMDSYIYKFKKSDYNKHLEYKEKYKKLEDEYQLFYKSLEEKYKLINSLYEWKIQLSEDDRKTLHDFSERFEKLESINYEEEMFYWRKPYNLHAFITSNFLPLGENDNCNHILLTKENIKLIIDKLKNDPSYFDCNMWDSNDTEQALKLFSEIYKNYSNEVVYTYYTWY
jgi:hypothetical protein